MTEKAKKPELIAAVFQAHVERRVGDLCYVATRLDNGQRVYLRLSSDYEGVELLMSPSYTFSQVAPHRLNETLDPYREMISEGLEMCGVKCTWLEPKGTPTRLHLEKPVTPVKTELMHRVLQGS
jgi:hypothetical protein